MSEIRTLPHRTPLAGFVQSEPGVQGKTESETKCLRSGGRYYVKKKAAKKRGGVEGRRIISVSRHTVKT
jgi:hypothetical protein